MHLFRYDQHLKELIDMSHHANIYIKEDVEDTPRLVEDELRKDVLDAVQDLNENVIVVRRLLAENEPNEFIAFGAECEPPRDLNWVYLIQDHVKHSFTIKKGLFGDAAEADATWAEGRCWFYDLHEAMKRMHDLLNISMGIDVKKSFVRSKGRVVNIRPHYHDPLDFQLLHNTPDLKASLVAIKDMHVAMLEAYKSLLAVYYSMCHKMKNTSPISPRYIPSEFKPVD